MTGALQLREHLSVKTLFPAHIQKNKKQHTLSSLGTISIPCETGGNRIQYNKYVHTAKPHVICVEFRTN